MYCPQCGSNQSDEMKFCKSCGAKLFAVREVVATRDTDRKFDWSNTWVAEMMLSKSERERRKEEIERQRGITPESRSHKEIKAGVITASAGVGLAIFLSVFMQGIILGGNIGADAVPVLSRLWVVGVIPFFIGVGLLINGLFVRRSGRASPKPGTFDREAERLSLQPGDTSKFPPTPSSVTEHTTRQLSGSDTK